MWVRSQDFPFEIYAMVNKINGKVYVGQTRQGIKKRIKQHFTPKDACPLLRRAVEKYGKDVFSIIKLDCAKTAEEANKKEMMWIKLHDSANPEHGYNLSLGGSFGHFNAATLEKMSNSHKGEKNHFYGKHHTEQARQKMSISKKGIYKYENHPRAKMILCIETGETFNCIKAAEEKYKIAHGKITEVCKGKYGRKTAGGYHWKYEENAN